MAEIRLTNGMVALVDDEDFERLCGFTWTCTAVRRRNGEPHYYAKRWAPHPHCTTVPMPNDVLRLPIMTTPARIMVDHINNNATLDNRKANLRIATKTDNTRNRAKCDTRNGEPTTSKYKGVCSSRRSRRSTKKYCASIKVKGKVLRLGSFASEQQAALAYDAAAREYFGEFAWLNADHFQELDAHPRFPTTPGQQRRVA